MENEVIKNSLKGLKIGDSMSFESKSRQNLKLIIDEMEEDFKIIKVSETIYSILRIDASESNAVKKVSEAVFRLNWFNQIKINCSPSYARALICKHNKENSDSIKVRKSGNGVVIFRLNINIDTTSINDLSDMIDELNYLIHLKQTPETIHDDDFDQVAEGESIVNFEDEINEEIID